MSSSQFARVFLAVFLIVASARAAPLDQQFEKMTSEGGARFALWGIYAAEAESGKVLADINGQRLFVPASNRKLVTAALATGRFKAETRFFTELRCDGLDSSGASRGNVVLYPSGDPTWMAQLGGGRPGESMLREIARKAREAGLQRVAGDLVIRTGRFEEPSPIPPGWRWDDLDASYAGRPAVLAINEGLAAVRITPAGVGRAPSVVAPESAFEILNQATTGGAGSASTLRLVRSLEGRTVTVLGAIPAGSQPAIRSLPMGNPVEHAAAVLAEAFKSAGITIDGTVRLLAEAPRGVTVLATVEGATATEALTFCMESSNNFAAESLYLLAGADRFGAASYRASYRLEDEFWKSIGVDPREVSASDGSGLSRENAITPNALVQLLRARRDTEWFVASLPVSGVSGTLRYRLSDDGMARRVRAKTGTLDGASALSGYVSASGGKTIVFSIMANNYTGSANAIRARIDEMVKALAAR